MPRRAERTNVCHMNSQINTNIRIKEDDEGYYSLVDKDGSRISDNYAELEFFTDNLAKVYDDERGEYALMQLNGEIIPEWFDEIEENGVLTKAFRDGDVALIDKSGRRVSDWFDDIEETEIGLVKVFKNSEESLIDYSGQQVAEWYDEIQAFEGGLAKVFNDNEEAIIDITGRRITDWYYEIEDFNDGLAIVSDENEHYAYINQIGHRVSPWFDDYDDLEEHREDYENLTELAEPVLQERTTESSAPLSDESSNHQSVSQSKDIKEAKESLTINNMYNEQIEMLINAALADGVLTEKEKQVLFKKAQSMGIDLDEFEMVLDARLVEIQKAAKEKADQSAPKSNKYGDVRKCPVCGAIVQAYLAKCPECGFEFSNVDANLSSQKLAAEVKNAVDESKKKECINLFPIPNTKADLLEFLTSLQPKMRDINDPLSSTYFKKYQECIAKAQVSFANDSLVKPFIDSFSAEKKSLQKKQFWGDVKHWVLKHKIISIILALFVIFMLLGGLVSIIDEINRSPANDQDLCEKAVLKAVSSGDLPAAQKLIDNYTKYPSWIDKAYSSLCEAYIKEGDVEKAKALAGKCDEVTVKKPIYNYLISNGMYDDAEKYIPNKYSYDMDSDYYNYMKECVEAMCKNEEFDRATKFVKRKVTYFSNTSKEEYSVVKVTNDFNKLIEAYK